ncbi:DNA topoisomerase 2 [Rhizoctonia solani AG-1 IA]|uniref:DNA topoisomerase 2 n=1 Tax=Thanatephorus cucumeris (strain AG1-IA) TaxID=983506 RepID=L8WTI6_THACA|nr:DNA topoisomerase 2 [Rhizoctonia solani AG-1 IA]
MTRQWTFTSHVTLNPNASCSTVTTNIRRVNTMSDSEEFNMGGDSGSEEFKHKAKKTTAKAKATSTSKAAPKAKAAAAPKKKVTGKILKPIENKKDDSDDDGAWIVKDDADKDDGSEPSATIQRKDKGASEMYEKLTQLEHILKRPDTYIGSIESISQKMWTFDEETKRMVFREVKFVPGLFKIVDEILVNAADNKINDASMDTIKVEIDAEEGLISVYNNGKGIPIEVHSKEKIWIPEMIFGHLLTSSNYDDDEKKLTGGRNGYGAKLTNIYSTEFTVETADKKTEQKYKQTWMNNMSKPGKAKITKNPRGEEFTKVSFRPDFKRFGMEGMDHDIASLLKRRVYDMAGTVKNVKVFLNGERIKIKNFKQYVEMYVNSAKENAGEGEGPKPTVIFEEISPRWEVGFALSDGSFQQISFANSIATTKGGTHVNMIAEQISKNLIAGIEKKNKGAKVKPQTIKNHMWIFVNSLIENPTFDSQTKEWLTLPSSKFGSRPHVSEDFMKRVSTTVAKSGIIDNVLSWAKFKADQENKKTDGTKRTRLTGIAKLSDANNAGGRHASECTLILTEGDSAKSLAEAGLSVAGRNNFGIFPLRGKLLNVREATHDQVMKNAEIQAIKQIMGLKHGVAYKDVGSLRYGSIMIMTDQVTKGNQKINFFTIPEFQKWNEENNKDGKWYVKYYKGLGTSKDSDAREYFGAMEKHMIPFAKTEEGERELIDMAFNKKKADDRKDWLRQFKPGTFIDHSVQEITYSDFINRELILFSMADNIRSIPSVVDGLKPGQRKVIFGTFKRKLKNEIKVAQLVGYISEKTAYHHGEQSLTMTIVNLAQNFVGSNNINLLKPEGQFGTRSQCTYFIQGGKDAASARYIFTSIPHITRTIFHPHDDALLNYLKDDNDSIEPEWYMPILPVILINGADGIGTGWSTSIPNYNPRDIVDNIKRLMNGEPQVPMFPWYRGFKGNIEKIGEDKYKVSGIVERTAKGVDIKELPIRVWTQSYKEQLEEWLVGTQKSPPFVKDYHEHHTTRSVYFELTVAEKDLEKAETEGFEKFFKLVAQISTSNMICFDANGKIKKYNSPEEILEEFYALRLSYYQKRKQHLCDELERQYEKLSNQARFVNMIIKKELVVSNKKKADLCAELRELKFRPFPKVRKAKESGENEDAVEEEEDEPVGANSDYDYLLGMVEKLINEQNAKEAEWNELLKRKAVDLWNEDLEEFLKAWDDMLEEDAEAEAVGTSKKKGTKLRTRKSIGGKATKRAADSGSEDDFKPTKAPAKRKPAAEKPAPAKATAKMESMDEDEKPVVVKKKPVVTSSKVKKEESDSDAPVIKVPAAAKGKGKAAVKRKSADEDDSDEAPVIKPVKKTKAQPSVKDFFDAVPTKPSTSKPKAAAKKKIISSDDEDESMVVLNNDDDDDEPPVVKRTTRPTTGKSKYVELSTDGDDNDEDDVYSISD